MSLPIIVEMIDALMFLFNKFFLCTGQYFVIY